MRRRRLKPWQASSSPTTSARMVVGEIREAHDVGREPGVGRRRQEHIGRDGRRQLGTRARRRVRTSAFGVDSMTRTSWPTRSPAATICANEISRLVLEMDDAASRFGRPRRRRHARGRRHGARLAWESDRRADRRLGWPSEADSRSAAVGRERVFLSFRRRVDLAQRQARLIGEVAFEQPVRAHDLQRETFAVRRQLELLTARHDEALRLHPADERERRPGRAVAARRRATTSDPLRPRYSCSNRCLSASSSRRRWRAGPELIRQNAAAPAPRAMRRMRLVHVMILSSQNHTQSVETPQHGEARRKRRTRGHLGNQAHSAVSDTSAASVSRCWIRPVRRGSSPPCGSRLTPACRHPR